MSRTLRAIIGAVLVLVITMSAISICQNIAKGWKVDITDQRLYTLSPGTKAILGKLNQLITAKLFYAKTAALQAPDQIRYFNNYYQFVLALLEEYVAASKGMIRLEVIDPRPFSEEEAEAMRYQLQKFPITQEESFFFGLVVQTQFGVEKVIDFFSPDRQNFVEYDISYLIDTAITRQKTKIGVLSSLPVMGDDMSGYMAQMMRMQGQQPRGPWTIVEQLRRQYEVNSVPADANDINDVDILLVIHPKDLPDQTLLAIDQFVLKGGRTIVCVDPHCLNDQPAQRNPMMPQQQSQKSDLNKLMRNWGLEMPENAIAGDLNLALAARMGEDGIVGFLGLRPESDCFNKDSVITAELNQVTMLFAGALNEVGESIDPNVPSLNVKRTPLVRTSVQGNVVKVDSPYELMFMDPGVLRNKFIRGVQPVTMGYLVTGKFKTAFPNGVAIETPAPKDESDESKDNDEDKTVTELIKPEITEAADDCAVVVFSDVDFLSDRVAYRESFFGSKMVVGDNSALLLNAIDDLSGSSDLVSIRSRGNFRRPFNVVDAIEKQAEERTAEKMKVIEAAIAGYNADLQKMVASAKEGEEEVLGNAILKQRRDLEQNIYDAERQKRVIRMERREGIDGLGRKLQRRNTLLAPAGILIVAVVLGTRRNVRRRHYISHASDA